MANKNNKQTKSAPKSTKTPAQSKAPKKAPEVQTPAVETAETTVVTQPAEKQVTAHVRSGLDANRRMDMITNIRAYFHDDPNASTKYGQNLVDVMEKVAVTGLVTAVADEVQDGKSTLAKALIKQDMYAALVVAGADMGVFLPAPNLLPAPDKDGNVAVPLDKIEMSEETKQTLAEEKKTQEAGDKGEIELDPKKLASMSEEDVKKALTYIMIKKPKTSHNNIGETLVEVKDFIHTYDKELASKAENSKEAIERIINRTVYDELKSAFKYVTPTFLFNSIAKGMDAIIYEEKCPLSAFIIMRKVLTDKDGNIAWTDEDIAGATRAIVELYCDTKIAEAEKAIAEDTKGEITDSQKDFISDRKKVLNYLTSFDYSICDWNKNEKFLEGYNATISKARGRILISYYPNCKDDSKTYIGLQENLSQRSGIILNLFRAPGESNAAYAETNLVEIEAKDREIKEEKATAEGSKSKEEVKNALPNSKFRDSIDVLKRIH